jgi:CHAD domain-containing protein
MAYRFQHDESVARGVERIIRGEIEDSVALLKCTNPDPAKRDEAVHEARKSIKKIRAVLRLLKSELGRTSRKEGRRFADIGRELSDSRDAAALIEVLGQVKGVPAKVTNSIRHGLVNEKKRIDEHIEAGNLRSVIADRLEARIQKVKDWPINNDGFESLAGGLKRTYRDGFDSLKDAESCGSTLAFHEFRKRVKDHWYHLRLLEESWTPEMRKREARLKDLETRLGDDHNLAVLIEKLKANRSRFGGANTVKAFTQAAVELEKELQRKAIELGHELYAQKPGEFVQAVREMWDAWQKPARKPATKATKSRRTAAA